MTHNEQILADQTTNAITITVSSNFEPCDMAEVKRHRLAMERAAKLAVRECTRIFSQMVEGEIVATVSVR